MTRWKTAQLLAVAFMAGAAMTGCKSNNNAGGTDSTSAMSTTNPNDTATMSGTPGGTNMTGTTTGATGAASTTGTGTTGTYADTTNRATSSTRRRRR